VSKRPTGRNAGDLNADPDASPQARQARAFAHKDRLPDLPLLHGHGCWCGSPYGHGWPGKGDGAPHPRDWPGRVNGRGYPT
jgi:hypothetical protein